MLIVTPAACPHALAADAGAGMDEPTTEHASHHHHGHGEHAPAEHTDHGCADDCDGGADCNGCAIGSMAVLTDTASPAGTLSPDRSIAPADARHGVSPGLDTPPPRA